MSVQGLSEAYKEWKENPCLQSFLLLRENGFSEKCRWSKSRKTIRVIRNLISGKYERFYKYYNN